MKVLWYQLKDKRTEAIADNEYKSPVNITDAVMMGAGKAIDIKNNLLTLTLRNPHSFYVDEYNELKFEEQDQIKIYVKYTNDGADIGSATWSTETITTPGTEYLLGIYYVVEFAVKHSGKDTMINLKCADKTYVLFNKVLSKAFIKNDNLTAPLMIQKIIRFSSQTIKEKGGVQGTGADSGGFYDIDARLDSERTTAEIAAGTQLITNVRKSTKEDGTANSDTNFPAKEMAKVWKPIYEWIAELSQIEKINTTNELNGAADAVTSSKSLTYGRPFIFWIDEQNRFRWVYPTDTVADYIEVGKFEGETLSYNSSQTNDAEVYNVNMTKKIFDVTNMIIYNAGTDMYGTGIWFYAVDLTSNVKTLKMRVVPMVDIAEKWKNLDYSPAFCPAANRNGTPAGNPLYQFPLTAVYTEYDAGTKNCAFPPTTTYANAAAINNDSNYNDSLRERCENEGDNRAKTLLAGLSSARWKGSITTKGKIYSVGNLVEFSDTSLGIYKETLRIMEVKQNISKTSWTTEISLEKDAKAVEVSI